MDTSIEQLVVAYIDGDLDEAGARRLAGHLDSHAADRAEFVALTGQDRAMQVLLGPAADLTAQVLNELRARGNGARFVGEVLEGLPRRTGRRRLPAALAAAATIVLGVGVAIWFTGRRPADPETLGPAATPTTIPTPTVALAAGWRIEPTGAAAYRIVAPDRVRLDRGELRVESTASAAGDPARATLNIDTPAGAASATGTTFYIGTHTEASQQKGTPMNRLTRVLVLAGVVTLSNPLGTVSGGPNDLLAAEAGSAPTKHAVQANSDFAFDLYAQFAKENVGKNLFFSPYSISGALAMTAEGARGQTAAEMGKVLRFPAVARRTGADAQLIPWQMSMIHTGMTDLNARLTGEKDAEAVKAARAEIDQLRQEHQAAKAKAEELRKRRNWQQYRNAVNAEKKIAAKLNAAAAKVDQYDLRIANALWGEKTYPFRDAYVNTINKHYKTGGVFPADFKTDFPAERLRINQWVEEQTNNRIKDLIPKGALDAMTRLVLTNAIFFKGEWSVPFKEADTKPCEFTLTGGKKVQTPTMNARSLEVGRYGAFGADGSFFNTPMVIGQGQKPKLYPGEGGFAVLELPYKGDDLSMVLLAPNAPDGLAAIESKLTSKNVSAWIAKLRKRKAHVLLPKFKMETDYKMKGTLQAMGMERAFMPSGADFTGMCASKDPRYRLYISKVLHKAFVEVNEKGTEAAAATAVIMTLTFVRPSQPFTPTFKADRPFVFLIRDVKTGSILFMGRMQKPTE